MKLKTLSLLLALVMVFGLLAACGGSSDSPEMTAAIGVYKLSDLAGISLEDYAEMMEITVEEAQDSMIIELKAGGKCDMTFDGDQDTLDWSLDGENISLTDGQDTLTGTLKDGTMVLDFEGDMVTLVKQ